MTEAEQKTLKETHDSVIRLEQKMIDLFNGGPGTWPACKIHADAIAEHARKIDALSTRVAMGMGGVGLISLLGVLVSIWSVLFHK